MKEERVGSRTQLFSGNGSRALFVKSPVSYTPIERGVTAKVSRRLRAVVHKPLQAPYKPLNPNVGIQFQCNLQVIQRPRVI